MSTPVDVGQDLVKAFNARDWETFGSLIADGCVYEEPATGYRSTDREGLLASVKTWVASFDDIQGEVTNAFGSDGKVALEITWSGTHTGDLNLGAGAVSATQRHVETKAVQIADVVDGKITANRHYLDIATLLTQLGLLPSPS